MDRTLSKRCPFCKLINPASAQVCDCGYVFMGDIPDPNQLTFLLRNKANRLIAAGVAALGLGLAVNLAISLVVSLAGWHHKISLGFIILGLVSLVKGIGTRARIKKVAGT